MTDDQASSIHDRIDELVSEVGKLTTNFEVRVALLERAETQSAKMTALLIGTGAAAIGATVAAIVSGLVVAFFVN